jgi:hypothetical protein
VRGEFKDRIFFASHCPSSSLAMDDHLVQWVECSRCQKWRIIHPRQENLPDEWFCEMNSDITRNTCDAPEEQYSAIPVVPVVKKTLRSSDPEAIRTALKSLTLEELEEAYKALDKERLFREEFGENLAAARSADLVTPIAAPVNTRKTKKHFDHESAEREFAQLQKESSQFLHAHIVQQFTR